MTQATPVTCVRTCVQVVLLFWFLRCSDTAEEALRITK